MRRRLFTFLALASTAGLFCSAHLSHAEREACLGAAAVVSAPAATDPSACLSVRSRI